MPSFCPQEEPATPRELGLGLGLGLKEKEEAVVAAAAGLEEASAAVAVGAGGAPAGPAVIGPSLPLALAMPIWWTETGQGSEERGETQETGSFFLLPMLLPLLYLRVASILTNLDHFKNSQNNHPDAKTHGLIFSTREVIANLFSILLKRTYLGNLLSFSL